ncbi:MAG TPA: hypothetical protein VGR57_03600, partial [Ktedonobacterales bacterium]|nr:hypothetical protein [Ktedonobacterales bacterium]
MTCPRCGQQVPPGVFMCPRCGAPLGAPRPDAGHADQGMPEWLRTAQGAPPNVPPGAPAGPGSLSVGSLLSDDAVPEWLRAAADGSAAQPSAPGAWGAPQPVAPGGWLPPSPAAG